MASPISVPTTPIIAIRSNRERELVRFQNTGTATLYFVRQLGHCPNEPSPTNYEFLLPASNVFDLDAGVVETESTAQFNVVADAVGTGQLAVFETVEL